MILPVVKLGTLVLKTLCRPIATRLKKEAGLHPKFRQTIVNFAQTNHRITTTIQRRIYGHATDVEIRPLNEEKAVQAAAELLGELFVFSVAGAALIFEVQRNARSEARKEELRRQELEAMKQRDEDLAGELELLKQKLEELEQIAKGRGLSGIFKYKPATEDKNKSSPTPATVFKYKPATEDKNKSSPTPATEDKNKSSPTPATEDKNKSSPTHH